jgi:glycosyltransferase involved in cell wall biosynthesis
VSPRASVVVPTRDRPDALRRCLAALERQVPAPVEVVVVDDASREVDAVASVVAASPLARLVRAHGSGPAAARNAGARAAVADVVCFTDDDCEPAPEWVAHLLAQLARGGRDAAVGRTVNARPGDSLAAASQAIVNALTEESLDPATGDLRFGPSCNLAVRADLVRREPFDEGFPLAAGEDREWCRRLTARGHRIAFARDAVVAHRPHLTTRAFVRQHHRYGRGAQRFWHGGPRVGRRRDPRMTPPRPGGWSPRLYGEILRSGFREGPAVGALVCLAQVATACGYARESIARSRRRAG